MAKRPRMLAPTAVGCLLSDTFHGTPLEHRLAESRIWTTWDTIVGEQIARQARPNAMRNGVLTVLVASAPWMQQLTFLKGELRERLNSHLGGELIKDIYLKAGKPKRSVETHPEILIPKRPLTSAELAAIATTVATISDTELRETCQRLLTAHHRSN